MPATIPTPRRNPRILPSTDPRIAADRRAAYRAADAQDIAEVRHDPRLRRAATLAALDLGALVMESHIALAVIRRRNATANGRADKLFKLRAAASTLRARGA